MMTQGSLEILEETLPVATEMGVLSVAA